MARPASGERGKIVFTGDLTDVTLDQRRDQLAEALMDSRRIEVELGKIGDVDQSLVELICSAHRVADSLGKSLTLGSEETMRKIRDLAKEFGYAQSSCKHRTSRCLYRDGAGRTARTEEE